MVLIGGNVMKTCTQEITLYVDRKNKYKYVYGKQSDTKSRFLKVTIVDGGKKVVLGSDDNAKFRALKPDGTAVFNDCVIEPDGTILVELSAQTLAVAGQVSADVVIIGKSDEILATANFCIIVEKAPVGKDVESSNEFLALVEAMNQAVKKDQGKENSGKVLAVGDDGIVVPTEIKVGDNSLVVSATINDDYQVVSCDTTFDDIDKAYAAGSSMLMKASIADSSIVVIAPFMQKTDSNGYIFAFDDGSVIYAIAIGESGTWATTAVQIDANKIPYELSEDFLADFPDFEELLEDKTVKATLDLAVYYAVAGMFAKYIQCDVPTATGTVTFDLQTIMDGWRPALEQAHTHDNKSILDLISAADGKLKYDGSDIGAELFQIPMTLTEGDGGYTVSCDVPKADVDAAYAAGKLPVILANAEGGEVTYMLPLLYPVNTGDGLQYIFGLTVNFNLIIAILDTDGTWSVDSDELSASNLNYNNAAMTGVTNIKAALDWLAANSTVTKSSIISALGYTPQAVSAQVTSGTTIALADNTEYRLTDLTTLTLTYPAGNFECWLKLTFAASGSVTVTLPTGTKYIGSSPSFANGETWEMSIKDGVVVAQKVGDGT